ncbi:MAG: DNA repair protein RadC [Gammaproteobacteria bacterium]|nr:DNA repair protein RadC [Gammaproteobacteria bacterium]MBL4890241.1 DNA repair protein RadC [Rhizobiaceae bacterium]
MITTKEQIVINQAKEILSREFMREAVLTSSSATKEYLKLHFAGLEHEMFVVVFLDNQHQVIAIEDMFRGTIDGAAVYPREVVKRSLELNAAALLLAHNHPSGVSEPSMADKNITKKLKDAAGLLDVRVLDHLVVGDDTVVSFAERGLI